MWNSFALVRNEALQLDALDSTHPILQTVSTPAEIDQLFDTITYNKGGAVLSMLSRSTLGRDAFRPTLVKYLKAHEEGSVKSSDIWAALADVTKETDVARYMDTWTLQSGFPVRRRPRAHGCSRRAQVIEIVASGPDLYVAQQSRFDASPPTTNSTVNNQTWWVPINIQKYVVASRASALPPRSPLATSDAAQTQITLKPDQVAGGGRATVAAFVAHASHSSSPSRSRRRATTFSPTPIVGASTGAPPFPRSAPPSTDVRSTASHIRQSCGARSSASSSATASASASRAPTTRWRPTRARCRASFPAAVVWRRLTRALVAGRSTLSARSTI